MKILYNGKPVNGNIIDPLSKGFQFGEGFFTTIKVINSLGENLKYHQSRISSSLDFFNFGSTYLNIENLIKNISQENNLVDFKLKIIIFRDIDRVSTIAIPGELPIPLESSNLDFSNYYRGNNPIFKYKSLNYYPNLKDSFNIILDTNNSVLETGIGNIFMIRGNHVITPPASLPLLPGTFRNYLLDIGAIGNFKVKEGIISKEELLNGDSLFFTNALRGIVPVKKVGNKEFDILKVLELKSLFS